MYKRNVEFKRLQPFVSYRNIGGDTRDFEDARVILTSLACE